jgi:GT2 family glycosyltransferase
VEVARGIGRRVGRRLGHKRLLDFDAEYRLWLSQHEPSGPRLVAMRVDSRAWIGAPLISVIMPVFDPDPSHLSAAIESVRNQAYEKWELCIADDGSTRPGVRELLNHHQNQDTRIRVVLRGGNGGIAAASNSAIELATGDYVAFLDHDDVLRAHALYRVAEFVTQNPTADVVYSDEDKILADGRRGAVFFKPDWSPEWLLSNNYLCHLSVLRRQLLIDIGGFRLGFDGSQDHDLLLRASERARYVGHIPDVLYSWRQVPGSAALSTDAKPAACAAGRRAVADALARRAEKAEVQNLTSNGVYNIHYVVEKWPSVAIVIPTRDRVDLLERCVGDLERRSTYRDVRYVIVDNDSRDPETLRYLDVTPHQVVRVPGAFNFSHLVNVGVRSVDAPFVLLLNNDAFIRTPNAIERLVSECQRREIGAAGCQLCYPDGRLQHCGVGLGFGYLAFNLDVDWPGVRNVSAVTGACMMIKRDVFDEVDGFDERLPVAFNDVDFCIRIRERGYRVIYTPEVIFEHNESATRGRFHPDHDSEVFRSRWGTESGLRDPYLNPNLTFLGDRRLHVAN